MATTASKVKKTVTPNVTKNIGLKSQASSLAPDLPFVFERDNYIVMVAGIAVIIVGFLLMMGSSNDNPATFPTEEIYSFRRITLAPMVVMIGFIIEIYAILKRPKAI
jgi:Protein of unknown function (DUF3098)